MKILILANNDVGLYNFRKELIEALLEENEIYISLPYGKCVDSLVEIGCKFIDTPLDRRGINPLKDLKTVNKYLRILRQIKPDLVITYTIKPNVYGGMLARFMKIPYAVNITGLGTVFQKSGLIKKVVTLMYKTALKKAKTVFFENIENLEYFCSEKIVNKEKTCLLNGAGVNTEKFPFTEYPKENDITRFLFIGRVMKEKGVDELLSACEKLYDEGYNFSLDILGYFEEDYNEKFEKGIKQGWLNYHGQQADVKPFIANCHCFVLPSWHEGMANTNLECASSGRPVITTNIHGCKEAVLDEKSGFLVEKCNATSLYDALKKFIMLSFEERKAMGEAAREHIKLNFDRKDVVTKTVSELLK